MMNRSELIATVAASTGGSIAQTQRFLTAFEDELSRALVNGESVTLRPGKFLTKYRAAAAGRNPRTGEAITVAAKRSAIFKPSTGLMLRLNPERALPQRRTGSAVDSAAFNRTTS